MIADLAVEAHVGNVELRLARVDLVDAGNGSCDFLVELATGALVKAFLVDAFPSLILVDAPFDSPSIRPLRRARVIGAKEIERARDPLVVIFLLNLDGNDARLRDAAKTGDAGSHVKGLLAKHRLHRGRERSETRVGQHAQRNLPSRSIKFV